MPGTVTARQKQFLRQLGYKDFKGLTKQSASKLIEELLEEEKASGKTFLCPYCKARFGPRPKRQVKCPECGQSIIHLSGKFYTVDQVDTKLQKEWLKEARKERTGEVKEEWREERQYRREMKEPFTVGYIIQPGPECPHSHKMDGLIVLIEDAYDTPDLLPPYDECWHENCACEFQAVSADEVPKKARIAEWEDPEMRAKLKTRKNSPVALKNKTGCVGVILAVIASGVLGIAAIFAAVR